jgi:intracellular multiplication protein IcmO
MAEIRHVRERQYKPKKATFLEIYDQDILGDFLRYIPLAFIMIGVYISVFTAKVYETYEIGLYLIYLGLAIQSGVVFGLFSSRPTFESKVLESNNSKALYMLNFGRECYRHLGDAIKSGIVKNLTGRLLLISAEFVKRMGVVIGTTGSGKTVMLKGLLEQQLMLGGGLLATDAKGTIDELKRIFAMVVKWGRIKDFFVLNFANLNNTNTIGVLHNGSALMCKEILMSLVSNDDPKWRQVDETHIESVLKLLVYKRDNEGLILTFDVVTEYMTLDKLLDEAREYRSNNDIFVRDFVRYVTTKIEVDFYKFRKAKDEDKQFWEMCIEKSNNADLQGVYEVGLSCGNWFSVLTTLGSNYGKIFNAKNPDIDLFEAVQNNKIIWIVLPTMESEETAQKIGKLILGMIKSVADQKIKNSFEPVIPFLFLLDEFGSIGIKGFGRFMSKGRSLGMSMWLFLQSKAQLDIIDDGKALESKELLDNANTFVLLKNKDAELAEYLSKIVPKETILDLNHKEAKNFVSNRETSRERDYQAQQEDALKAEYFSELSNGEMYLIQGKDYYKGISCVPSDFSLSYREKDTQVHFPLNKTYPKEKFINDLRSKYSSIFRQNVYYNRIDLEKEKSA